MCNVPMGEQEIAELPANLVEMARDGICVRVADAPALTYADVFPGRVDPPDRLAVRLGRAA